MPSQDDIADQQALLLAHRQTLNYYLKQRAHRGDADLSPAAAHDIRAARADIQRIKTALRSWGEEVEDHPDDADSNAIPDTTEVEPEVSRIPFHTLRWLRILTLYAIAMLTVVATEYVIPTTKPLINNETQTNALQSVISQPSWASIATAFMAIISGGLLWNLLNLLLRWSFHRGGSKHEPYGFPAFIWGFITNTPVILFAILIAYEYSVSSFDRAIAIASTTFWYALFSGLGAYLFYHYQFRQYIETKKLSYGSQELIIVAIWSIILSASTCIPLLLQSFMHSSIINARLSLLQIPFALLLSVSSVIASFFVARSTAAVELLRGVFTGIALRAGLFIALLIALY